MRTALSKKNRADKNCFDLSSVNASGKLQDMLAEIKQKFNRVNMILLTNI